MSIIETCNVKYSYDGNRAVLKNISTDFEVRKIYASPFFSISSP